VARGDGVSETLGRRRLFSRLRRLLARIDRVHARWAATLAAGDDDVRYYHMP
jgi:hypothetical protein